MPVPGAFRSSNEPRYAQWIEANGLRASDIIRMEQVQEFFPLKPKISILVPVFNPLPGFLEEAVESVLQQVYPHWELCLVDDASTDPRVWTMLGKFSHRDPRIRVQFRSHNGHICAATNTALDMATGEFVALLDQDDLLSQDALHEVAFRLNQHPATDMLYSDEDKIAPDGTRCEPIFKPDWSPEMLLSTMYTCHLGVYRRSLVFDIGGFRPGFEGSQDYDLVLRFSERTNHIIHIPRILYHQRMHSTSAAKSIDAKPYAYAAGQRALSEALRRRQLPAQVRQRPVPWGYHLDIKVPPDELVSIIILTRDQPTALHQCLRSIDEKSTHRAFEIIVVDNGSRKPEVGEVLARWRERLAERLQALSRPGPFNYSQLNNEAVTHTKGRVLLFLNDDIEVLSPRWLESLLGYALQPEIGAVGALLFYPNGTIQHAGVILDRGGASHAYRGAPSTEAGYVGWVLFPRNVSAVTGACLMCRKEAFEQVGKLDEKLEVAYNDIDFCLKLLAKGYRNVYVPDAILIHHESLSQGNEDTPKKIACCQQDATLIRNRWEALIENDPCFNPHLLRTELEIKIRV